MSLTITSITFRCVLIVIKPYVEKVNITAVSIISHVDYRKYFPTLPLDSTSVTLKTYSGEKIIPERVMHVKVQYNNQILC
jgi:hypothetical protein